jgi:porin
MKLCGARRSGLKGILGLAGAVGLLTGSIAGAQSADTDAHQDTATHQSTAEHQDTAAGTYNHAPLSDSSTTTVEGPDEPAPALLKPTADWLLDHGVNFRGSLIDQWARNPSGGVREGHTNVGQFNAGLDLNLQKLVGLPGGYFHFVVYRDYGDALNQDFTGTFTKQQYIYKNAFPRWHLGLFAYEQKLLNDRIDIFIGRLGSTNYYGHLVANCQFISANLCGEPRVLVAETGLSLLPSATWGTNIKYRPTPHSYVEVGAFEVNPAVQPSNGLNWSTNTATGVTVPFEWAWVDSNPKTTAYPFEWKAGAFLSTAPLTDPFYNTRGQSRGLRGGTARTDGSERYGVYTMADRVIWRPNPDTTRSLNLFGGWVQLLEDDEIMRNQVYGGVVLTAPFDDRPRDSLAIQLSEFELTSGERYFIRDARIKAGGSGTNAAHQWDYDLTYTFHVIRGVELMGSLQYLIDPDNSVITNTRTVPGNLFAISLGFRMDLGYAAGFGRGAASD